LSIPVIRRFRSRDLPQLRQIHAKCAYGFHFPEIESMIAGRVIEDPDGNVVGFVGAQLEAQIFGIFDPDWGTPGERMGVFAALHRPMAEKLAEKGVKDVYVALDPKFPSFGRRLMSFGWKKALWQQFFCPVGELLQRFGGRTAT
jgi:hypothetical protein